MAEQGTGSRADDGKGVDGRGVVDRAVAEGGAYEVLHKRLADQGQRLRGLADALNARRLETFGSSRMALLGRLRVRTENNCVARDLVQVGSQFLFGYNVFLGLKKETRVEDVFSLYELVESGDGFDVTPVAHAESFLGEDAFVQDFRELYAYYKDTRLVQLALRDGKLLAAFQIGERLDDLRVFRWSVADEGREVRYIDNRGERDIALPAPYDFEWTEATREMAVNGRHPHLNILDTVFVETLGGDLTIKIEDNTEDGEGIYREPVEDKTQSLDDARVAFARLGTLVLLKVLPYRETDWRYLVYNTLTRQVRRIDEIGQACIQLPEDHGIVFPGGYYLQNGEYKAFEQDMRGMRFSRSVRSPNGEDVLYVFYEPVAGRTALFTYNMIERRLQPPMSGHGMARLDDGRMVIFSSESDAPTRVHPMQVWETPFSSDEFAARQPVGEGFMGRIGNAELVRGISDLFGLVRAISADEVSAQRYEQLAQDTRRLFDLHHWIADPEGGALAPLLHEIVATSESVIDEYEKVEGIRRQSREAMADAATRQKALMGRLLTQDWDTVQPYVEALGALSRHRGHLLGLREQRYIDVDAVDAMEAEVQAAQARIGEATGTFLASDRALQPFADRLDALDRDAQAAESVRALSGALEAMQAMSADLDTLSELMASLQVEDATQRTRIVESISGVYARLNQAKARADQRRKALGANESMAQFGAQFSLFSQSIASALSLSQDPERCDEQLSRLMVQLEELESQFGEHEQFLADILAKREEMLETFEAHKQALLDERQRKAQAVADAALRILEGLPRRTERLADADALHAFFAGDPLILKLRELVERLRNLRDNVRADDVESRLKGARDQAVRGLRDRSELFEAGGDVIKLGPRHRFSVNTQPLDLTVMPRGDGLSLHLTGTDYFEPLHDATLDDSRAYWQLSLDSESSQLYRGEYLAGLVLDAAREGREGLDLDMLAQDAAKAGALDRRIRDFAAPRYREGYEKGIHDHDAALILQALLPLQATAGSLVHAPAARALAWWAWGQLRDDDVGAHWPDRARTLHDIARLLGRRDGIDRLVGEVADAIDAHARAAAMPFDAGLARPAAVYLVDALAARHPQFLVTRHARDLLDALRARLGEAPARDDLEQALDRLADRPGARWSLARDALQALCADPGHAPLARHVDEAVALLLLADPLALRVTETDLHADVEGLLGEHPRIEDGRMRLAVDDFAERLQWHREHFVPGFQRYQAQRQAVVAREREAMRLDEFKPRPLSSFVRNKLINDVYLSVIGDNLAKQMGTVGESKRSDLMGLLMMISPPGYGKTTLMEYVAHRLGLNFMKINGPALGHQVRSLDPAQAPDATAAQELHKLNLALEMGNNVMLYVDDIQHTHPEFLQKFISLCDGTRRIEGVWKGRTRTYDMRGRKFCVVMAGNPYTESGEVFRIPDMLANRADIYNLGDVLGGMEDSFTLSYIENALTSNPVLAPLATRDLADLYRFVDRAQGREFSANALSHAYSGAEINEITATLERLLRIRDVVYRVNQQYIASAAQADKYRTEPPFRLQGSYRNMNKLAEKVSPVMNEAELQQLIADHYLGEAQLLTTGAEENLLKLAELRGVMDDAQRERWAQIKRDFLRNKAMGADDADVGGRVVAQLADLVEGLKALGQRGGQAAAVDPEQAARWSSLLALLERLAERDVSPPVATPREGADAWLDGLAPLAESLQARSEQQSLLLGQLVAHLDGRTVPAALSETERQKQLEQALAEFADRLHGRTRR
ncbi:DNA repair ATPase [Marilutibacter aestuarii]|uniref:AAA family ATPase n=1 Tax=Marilutibacter aestuarii TaxID=1706195 RepID=A0A508AAB8_9GAMM|nr:DNA repair ATPase [Lysobacter aestuarii]TQD45481.1 AAA family ATPase [Lysobacter aestuarii]